MKLTIVYDNEAIREDLKPGWGFSCHIETNEANILFDTGWDGSVLLSNMHMLGVNPKNIDKVVLSHPHWDHIGGLPHILTINPELTVYAPKSFSEKLKAEISRRVTLIEVSKSTGITGECASTGELGSSIIEQSLVIKIRKGSIIVTGCAHPTLKSVLSTAQCLGNVYGFIGGFHEFNDYDLLKNIQVIAPCHCTLHKHEIAELYPDAYIKCGVGKIIEIE